MIWIDGRGGVGGWGRGGETCRRIRKTSWFSVHHQARVQGDAKVPPGDGPRLGAHLQQLWPRWHGLRVPDDGNSPHALLEQGPIGDRLRQLPHVAGNGTFPHPCRVTLADPDHLHDSL
jgi:hypothetical protein